MEGILSRENKTRILFPKNTCQLYRGVYLGIPCFFLSTYCFCFGIILFCGLLFGFGGPFAL